METPYLPKAIFGKDFENVYEPAEDTFLLLDALEKDLETLKQKAFVCLECGSGSGTVITALSKALGQSKIFIATDINQDACRTTRKCSLYHNQNNIQIIKANLAEPLVDRLKNQVDLLIFNPPYVPTDEISKEKLSNTENSDIHLSWAGGNNGCQITNEFLTKYVPRLLSKPDGVAYLIALEQNNINQLLNYLLKDFNIKGVTVMQRKTSMESLYVIKYSWIVH